MNLLWMLFCLLAGRGLCAQQIQEINKGEYILVFPDGTLQKYDAKNPAHKKLMDDFQKENVQDKTAVKEVREPTVDLNNPVQRKLYIVSLLKKINLENEKGIEADTAYFIRIRAEKALKNLQNSHKVDKARIKLEKEKVGVARSTEKIAVEDFNKAATEAGKARKELSELKIDVQGQPPYQLKSLNINNVLTPTVKKKAKAEKPKAKQALDTKKKEKVKKEKAKKEKEKKSSKKTISLPELPILKKKPSGPEPAPINAEIVKADQKLMETPAKIIKLDPKDDVMQNPPHAACSVFFEGKDEFSGKYRKEISPSLLFSFTDASMKKFYEKNDFLTCEAYFSLVEGSYKYLAFIFTIASENVQPSYGWLEKDNLIQVKLLDGSTLNLYNSRTDRGVVNTTLHNTTYRAYCTIGSGEEKILAKSEADAIRVQWSTGTEDYEVYDVDFFADQLKCLNKKSK